MKKKSVYFIPILAILTLVVWYFFIKKSDYIITFEAKANSGTIMQAIEEWSIAQEKISGAKYITTKKELYSKIEIKLIANEEILTYDWEISSKNDTLSKIEVGITSDNFKQSLMNRLIVPFFESDFKKVQLQKASDIRKGLREHLEKFKVEFNGESATKDVYVAYISLESVMQEKAQTMIGNDNIISGFLYKNGIKIIGTPYVDVTKWDQKSEKLEFDYCFPIDANTPKIADAKVKYKFLKATKGLKATYFGNFRTSDRAWFTILDVAKKQNINLSLLPLEHFLNNPFNGGNELEWKTEIVIPYQNQK